MLERRREVMEAWADYIKPKAKPKGGTRAYVGRLMERGPQKITFGKMRASGVRDVLIYCRDHASVTNNATTSITAVAAMKASALNSSIRHMRRSPVPWSGISNRERPQPIGWRAGASPDGVEPTRDAAAKSTREKRDRS